MTIKPLEIQLVIAQDNFADTKEAAAQKPIKFVLKRNPQPQQRA